jgi:hypothetical protein
MDCCAAGNQKGITILLGGDHSDRHFWFHAKIHLWSSMEQKARKDISCQCPIVQVAWCECAKDKRAVLKATVMPRLAKDIATVQGKCAVLVCDSSDIIHGPRKTCNNPKIKRILKNNPKIKNALKYNEF